MKINKERLFIKPNNKIINRLKCFKLMLDCQDLTQN